MDPDLDELVAVAARDASEALSMLEAARRGGSATAGHLYLEAQLRSRRGEHDEALQLIDDAATAFHGAGDELGAARCDAGRSHVLADIGRPGDAAAAARRWLAWLEGADATIEGHLTLIAQARATLGVHLEDAGDYVGSLDAHDAAIAAALDTGDEPLAASMQVNRANVLNLLGRSPEAFDALVWSATVLEQAGDRDALAVVAINAGESLCRMGRPDDGLEWFTRADELVPLGSPDRAVLIVETADALAALGAIEEAARRYHDALDLLERAPRAWLAVRAWSGAGRVARELGNLSAAAAALARASTDHLINGNAPGWAVTESEALGLLPIDAPDRAARVAGLAAQLTELDEERWPVQACQAHLNLAALAVPGDGLDVEHHLRAAQGLADASGVPHLAVRAGTRLAEMFLRGGHLDQAAQILEHVLLIAERLRGRLHTDELLRTFPITVESAHDALVQVRLAQGRVLEAVALADAGRARAIVGYSDPSAARGTIEPDDVDAELSAIYDRLLASDGSVHPALRRELDERASRLEARGERLELTSKRRARPSPADQLPDVGTDEIQAVFQITDGRIGLFARDSDGTCFHPDLAELGDIAEQLATFHSIGRRALAMAARPGADLAPFVASAGEQLRRLGDALLSPVATQLGNRQRLVVVPHRGLHTVPFHALEVDGAAALDRVEVTVTPSLAARANRPVARDGPTLLVGVGDDDLLGADAELDALEACLDDTVVLRGRAATIAAVTTAMGRAGCIHIASHGIFRGGSPMASGVRLADGWLTARQLATLDLSGATIVLSACETGRSVVAAGDELLGLQRGLFLAGAHGAVTTLWPAVDDAAQTTMIAFHEGRCLGLTSSAALRRAWIEARRRHPHPWWWAPFSAFAV